VVPVQPAALRRSVVRHPRAQWRLSSLVEWLRCVLDW